ncbi:helix-turn-helix domain-containing protein [Acidobacteria bacterium AH-259-D05]|nr:helix-turn-helix domain-containing protein [Acidobacteria bacterium AH-259-D05]
MGERIQKLRKEKKLSQAKLAELADLSTNYIGTIERGEAEPTLSSIFAIADALKVNTSFLLATADRRESKEETMERIRELLDMLEKQS